MGTNRDQSRLERLIEGKRRSGLELIVGSARYVDELILNSTVWIGGMIAGGIISVVLAGNAGSDGAVAGSLAR